MGDPGNTKDFVTKLSLPKFVSMINRLTENQRALVCSMGFENLLHLCCEYLPHGLIRYLVKNFDPKARTLKLREGCSYVLSPMSVNKVLGTPIGGKHIGEKVDPQLRDSIAQLTKCQGHYPTINELDKIITPELEGNPFKVIFVMFAMTAFFCPSSHDAVSPLYLHVVRNPEEISSFDFSLAVLDKLAYSIDTFNEGSTCVLGGNLLLLMIIYFEFLDSDVIPTPSKSMLPRLSVWSSTLVHDIELMDCVCRNTFQYGRLPVKDVTSTTFQSMSYQVKATSTETAFDNLLNLIFSICPNDKQSVVKDRLPSIMANMYKEIMDAVEPIVIKNISNVLSLVTGNGEALQINIPISAKSGNSPAKDPDLSCVEECPIDGQVNSALSRSVVNSTPAVVHQQSITPSHVESSAPNLCSSPIMTETEGKEDTGEYKGDDFFMLPVPNMELVDKLYEEEWKNTALCSMQCMLDVLKTIPTESGFDLPCNTELLESLYPQKVVIDSMDDCTTSILDIVSYLPKESENQIEQCKTFENKVYFDFEKVSFPQQLDSGCNITNIHASTPTKVNWNPNKRTLNILKHDIADHCVALKKRAKMFEINEEPSTTSEVVSPAKPDALSPNEQIEQTTGSNLGRNDSTDSFEKKEKMDGVNEAVRTDEHSEKESVNPPFAANALILAPHEQCEPSRGTNDDGELYTRSTPLFCSHEEGGPISIKNADFSTRSTGRFANFSSAMDDEEFDRELLISTLNVEAQFSRYRDNSQFLSQHNPNTNISEASNSNVIRTESEFVVEDSNFNSINSQDNSDDDQNVHISEVNPSNVISTFSSTLVEADVFDDIISRIPKTKKAKTRNVVRMGSTWVEHRVFALSMMVYGNVNPYVINMLGKAVMVEDAEKEKLNLLPSGHWKRFFLDYKVSALFMKPCENPLTLSNYIAYKMLGIKLDSRDLVHLPLFTWGFYFLVVVNFKEKVFEVLYPNTKGNLVSDHANTAINNFKLAFKIAYKRSIVKVDDMPIIFRSVCPSEKDSDSGVYVMELIRNQTGRKLLCFQPTHAKPLRESLTYYMLAHPCNELMPPETINILRKHKIPYNYKDTPGYYPWMHEQAQASSDQNDDMMDS